MIIRSHIYIRLGYETVLLKNVQKACYSSRKTTTVQASITSCIRLELIIINNSDFDTPLTYVIVDVVGADDQ